MIPVPHKCPGTQEKEKNFKNKKKQKNLSRGLYLKLNPVVIHIVPYLSSSLVQSEKARSQCFWWLFVKFIQDLCCKLSLSFHTASLTSPPNIFSKARYCQELSFILHNIWHDAGHIEGILKYLFDWINWMASSSHGASSSNGDFCSSCGSPGSQERKGKRVEMQEQNALSALTSKP